MWKKILLGSITFSLLISLGVLSSQSGTAYAQGASPSASPSATDDGDTTVTMDITGVIQSITQQSQSVWILLLDDGSKILVNPATYGPDDLKVGATITVTVNVDDDHDGDTFVAKIITSGSPTPTSSASASPTVDPSATTEACGSGNKQPVAQRLADATGASYDEIMAWHCQGFGFGEIAKAYLLAKKTGKTPGYYFDLKKGGAGWGSIIKDAIKDSKGKFSQKDLSMGQAIKGNGGKPTKATSNTQGGGKGKGGDKGGGKGGDNGGKGKGGKG